MCLVFALYDRHVGLDDILAWQFSDGEHVSLELIVEAGCYGEVYSWVHHGAIVER